MFLFRPDLRIFLRLAAFQFHNLAAVLHQQVQTSLQSQGLAQERRFQLHVLPFDIDLLGTEFVAHHVTDVVKLLACLLEESLVDVGQGGIFYGRRLETLQQRFAVALLFALFLHAVVVHTGVQKLVGQITQLQGGRPWCRGELVDQMVQGMGAIRLDALADGRDVDQKVRVQHQQFGLGGAYSLLFGEAHRQQVQLCSRIEPLRQSVKGPVLLTVACPYLLVGLFAVRAVHKVPVPSGYRDPYFPDKILRFFPFRRFRFFARQQDLQFFGNLLPGQERHRLAYRFQVLPVVLLIRTGGVAYRLGRMFPEPGQRTVVIAGGLAQGIEPSRHGGKLGGKVPGPVHDEPVGQCRQFPIFLFDLPCGLFVVCYFLKKRVHLNFFFLSPFAFWGIRSGLATLWYSLHRS